MCFLGNLKCMKREGQVVVWVGLVLGCGMFSGGIGQVDYLGWFGDFVCVFVAVNFVNILVNEIFCEWVLSDFNLLDRYFLVLCRWVLCTCDV